MIWHAVEVWLLLFAAFVLGCMGGAVLRRLLAISRFAEHQDALAARIGAVLDRVRTYVRPRPRRAAAPLWREPWAETFPAGADAADGAPRQPGPSVEALAVGGGASFPLLAAGSGGGIQRPAETGSPIGESGGGTGPASAEPPMTRPVILEAPRNGIPDDLQRIRGIGHRNEALLNALGIYHFGQIAAWTPAEAQWVAAHLPFPERLHRDDWIGQATILASGGDTGYRRGDSGEAP